MLERLALALLIGGIAGYALAKRNEPDIDWDNATDTISFGDIIADLCESGELQPRDKSMICQQLIEDYDG